MFTPLSPKKVQLEHNADVSLQQNYQFSSYIAELANSLSNIVTIALAMHGCRMARSQSLPTRYFASFAARFLPYLSVIGRLCGSLPIQGFGLVGIGSFAFHATLLYEAQLADELPMFVSNPYH
jgi:dihydroceramidase